MQPNPAASTLDMDHWLPCTVPITMLKVMLIHIFVTCGTLHYVRCVPVDDSIQVWRPVFKSAWHEQSSSPGCQPHYEWLLQPGLVWLKHLSLSILIFFPGSLLYTIRLILGLCNTTIIKFYSHWQLVYWSETDCNLKILLLYIRPQTYNLQ